MAPTMLFPRTSVPYFPDNGPASCPECGFKFMPEEALRRVRDLEAQVKLLNSKAEAAVDKLADYEDEIRFSRTANAERLQQQQQQQHNGMRSPTPDTNSGLAPPPPVQTQGRLSSLSALLPGRRKDIPSNDTPTATLASSSAPHLPSTILTHSPPSNLQTKPLPPLLGTPTLNHSTPNLTSPIITPSPQSSSDTQSQPQQRSQSLTLTSLQSSLETERTLRLRAESSLTQTQTEIEELTAQLFGQANEMVATERKARAKLEERVAVLEKRDLDKRIRLERLEKCVERIERVRGLVGGGTVGGRKQK